MTSQDNSDNLSKLFPYADIILGGGEATLGERQRNKMKDKTKKEKQRGAIIEAVCALLNSGGGIVIVRSDNPDYKYMKDQLGKDIEDDLKKLITVTSAYYCDFQQHKSYLLIFIKTWIVQDKKPKLCTLNTGAFIRSDTSKMMLGPAEVCELVEKKTKEGVKKARLFTDTTPLQYIKKLLKKTFFSFDEELKVGESYVVEFKRFTSAKMIDRMKEIIKDYVSAFANSSGGYLIIGVDDETHQVKGCDAEFNEKDLRSDIQDSLSTLKQVHFDNCSCDSPKPSNHDSSDNSFTKDLCKMTFIPVKGKMGENKGFVIFLKVQPVCSLVFAKDPQSWILDSENKIKELSASEWSRKMMTNCSELSLEDQFERLTTAECPPQAKIVYRKKNMETLEQQQLNLFGSLDGHMKIVPENLYSDLKREHPVLEDLLKPLISDAEGIVIVSRSWAVNLELPSHPGVVCDALVLIPGRHPTLYFVFNAYISEEDFDYCRRTALALKQKLVNIGSYTDKLCIIPDVLHLKKKSQFSVPKIKYPKTYQMHSLETVKKLLPSLAIVVLHFRSFLSDKLGIEYFNLLTTEQYNILSKKMPTKGPFFVHGPPGTGKTVLALETIKKIKHTYNCSPDEILYICENEPLRDYVQTLAICTAVTRLNFLAESYPRAKHIVADEAQNFQCKNDDWFKKAKEMVSREGCLIIFLDHFQSCHRRKTGLPPLKRQKKEILTEVIRSPENIYGEMRSIMEKIVGKSRSREFLTDIIDKIECRHGVSGVYEPCNFRSRGDVVKYVAETCEKYLSEGHAPGDIAILCCTEDEVERYRPLLTQAKKNQTKSRESGRVFVKANAISKDRIVLDSVHNFSGLERQIVFAIHSLQDRKVDDNVLLCAASRATARLHAIYVRHFNWI